MPKYFQRNKIATYFNLVRLLSINRPKQKTASKAFTHLNFENQKNPIFSSTNVYDQRDIPVCHPPRETD